MQTLDANGHTENVAMPFTKGTVATPFKATVPQVVVLQVPTNKLSNPEGDEPIVA